MTSWITLRARSQFGRTLLALVSTAAIALVLAAHANAAATTINVNSGTGNDTNSGSATSPLKTLTKALTLAHAGTTISLAGGDYSFGSGERFSPFDGASPQVVVPSGVTIQGNAGSGAATDLNGSSTQIGLLLAGDATIRNVGLFGFGAAIKATQGTQTLSGIQVRGDDIGNRAEIGIWLSGTANTTLSGAVHLSPNVPFAFGQTTFENLKNTTGVFVSDGAQFTMTGGGFFGSDQAFAGSNPAPNCNLDQGAIFATTSAQVHLHSVLIDDVTGGALTLQGDSLGFIDGSTIKSDYDSNQCAPPPALNADVNTLLSVTNSTIASNGVGSSESTKGIKALGNLEVGFSTVEGFNDKGIVSGPDSSVAINASKLVNDGVVCLNTTSTPAAGSVIPVRVTNSAIEQCIIGVDAQSVLMQGSTVTNNQQTGVAILGPYADLGTLLNPGGNDFQGNAGTGVAAPGGLGTSGVIDAVGDLWNPVVQGANAFGFYPNLVTFTGRDPEAMGQNFQLGDVFGGVNPADSINLGPLVGLAKVTPQLLHVKAGHGAGLKVSWWDPRAWRDLRSIQVRLYRGTKLIAQVTIDPRHPRLGGTGALRLLKVTHAGKTVTANLRLDVLSRLAGQTLRVAVQATDNHGQRQLEPDAGTIRITRSAN